MYLEHLVSKFELYKGKFTYYSGTSQVVHLHNSNTS